MSRASLAPACTAALRQIDALKRQPEPALVARLIAEAALDGPARAAISAAGVSTVTVIAVNDAPAIDADANDSSGQSGADYATTFYEAVGSVGVVDVDGVLFESEKWMSDKSGWRINQRM